jgi:hypothetical protein
MRFFVLILYAAAVACTGSLTQEQRQQIRENQRQGAIRKVGEAELLDGALTLGRTIAQALEARPAMSDSIGRHYRVRIADLVPGQPGLSDKEQQLLDAYLAGGTTADNLQKLGDTILYTRPFTRERPDGTTEFIRAVGVRMPVKEIILSLEEY